ncbi:MAG: hypothetical protein HWE27_13840 [Gammaproteobacteria bacterium]|nr:hypothetical protein [Gammaproteobacteria bacterium]
MLHPTHQKNLSLNSNIQNFVFKWLVLFITLSLSTGCAFKVKLVGQYDALVDQSVLNLQSETESHINTILENSGQGAGSYDQSKDFYTQSIGKVDALITRAKVLEDKLKRQPLTDNFIALKQQYEDLRTLHKMPFNQNAISSGQKSMQQSFDAIVKHLVFLKWNQEQPEI